MGITFETGLELSSLRDALATISRFVEAAAHGSRTSAALKLKATRKQLHDVQRTVDRAVQVAGGGDEPSAGDRIESTFENLLRSGALIATANFLEQMGWTKQALSKATRADRIFYLEVKGNRAYPAFFLDARYDRKVLESVSKSLAGLSGGSKWEFFTTPLGSLATPAKRGQENGTALTPLQALEAGRVDAVKQAAAGFLHG